MLKINKCETKIFLVRLAAGGAVFTLPHQSCMPASSNTRTRSAVRHTRCCYQSSSFSYYYHTHSALFFIYSIVFHNTRSLANVSKYKKYIYRYNYNFIPIHTTYLYYNIGKCDNLITHKVIVTACFKYRFDIYLQDG